MTSLSLSCIGEGNGNPLQCSCLENPRHGGAWWAAVYGVAQSRTRLKRLSSSSSCVLMSILRFQRKALGQLISNFKILDFVPAPLIYSKKTQSMCVYAAAAAAASKSLQSCPTLCDPIDGSPPGSPVPGIFQARRLEWVAISFSNA